MKLNFAHSQMPIDNARAKLMRSLFDRPDLDYQDRILVSISALQTRSDTSELNDLLSALEFDNSEIPILYEVLLQGYLFCGFPRAIESLICFHNFLNSKGLILSDFIDRPQLEISKTLYDRGLALSRQIHKAKFEIIHNRIIEISPDLGYLMIAEGYGRILHRSRLGIKSRELAIIGSLASQQALRQLDSHIRGARNVDCSDLEVYEAIITSSICFQAAAVENALQVWKKITGKEITDSLSGFVV